jgi:hypothetical protein
LARGDKHIVLSTTNPARPRVSSMHTKLDHTKIDTSLYQKVGLSSGKFHHFTINPLTPELNPSAQRCLTRFFTGNFAS